MDYASIEWRDGQPYSQAFDDVYFSVNDGRSESEYVFLQQNDLDARFSTADQFVIAETGFGTGLNFALTLKLWQERAPAHAQLDYFAIEFAPLSPEDIARAAQCWPELADYFSEFLTRYPLPVAGRHLCSMANPRVRLHLMYMDVCEALQDEALGVDAWFLDGFSPAKNPQIWNQSVYALIAQNSATGATLATYSAAGSVRRGLEQAGFVVEKRTGHGQKREMIFAQLAVARLRAIPTAPWFRSEKTLTKSKQGIVIGAGLAGLATAWSLIKRGWQITLIDKHAEPAGEASGNPVGLVLPRLSVDDTVDAKFYATAFLHAVQKLAELQASQASVNGEKFWNDAGVYYSMPFSRAQRLLAKNSYHSDYLRGIENDDAQLQLLAGSSLFLIPRGGWASPEQICAAMRAACGDRLHYVQAEIMSIQQSMHTGSEQWQLLSNQQKVLFETGLLVLANGVDSVKFIQTEFLPIQSARGQITRLVLKQGDARPKCAYSAEHYLAPALDNDFLYYCGASYHLNDDCAELRVSDQQSNLKFANQCYPGVFVQPDDLCGRVGFRAVSDDRMPVVGRVPDLSWFENEYGDIGHGRPEQNYPAAKHLQGLYLSAAHGSRGMTSCFLAAEILAAEIDGTPSPVDQAMATALSPARFIIRRLRRGD